MTALSWAIGRGNQDAIDALVDADANPWIEGNRPNWTATFWAAMLGDEDNFRRLAELPDRPFEVWPSDYVNAALTGGNRDILSFLLSQPHRNPSMVWIRNPKPAADLIEMVLEDAPEIATEMMFRSLRYESRPDLLRVALAQGADPNGTRPGSQETALEIVAKGFEPEYLEMVEALLNAGANPNHPVGWNNPIQSAFRTIQIASRRDQLENAGMVARARAIFALLAEAGADINLADNLGRPGIWAIMCPVRRDPPNCNSGNSLVTPAQIEFLVENGIDLNATYNGRRVLGFVEDQVGRDSDIAITMRRLGARR